MSSETASSVSKGVFVFKGTKKRAKAEDYFAQGDTGVDLTRMKILNAQWENTNEEIQMMQSELNTILFNDLIEYVEVAPAAMNQDVPQEEIPTAALITGVNVSDHAGLFGSLVHSIRDRATRHVAVLRSKDCPTIRAAVTKTLGQLIGQDDKMELEEDDEQLKLNKISCTFDTLVSWYKHACESSLSPPPVLTPEKRPISPLTVQTSPSQKPVSPRRQLLSLQHRKSLTASDRKSLRSPRKQAESEKEAQSPRKRTQSPRKQVNSPRKEAESPRKRTQSPRKEAQSPRKRTQSPRKEAQSPRKRMQSPRKEVQSPKKEAQSPKKQLLSPRKETGSPRKVQSPRKQKKAPIELESPPRVTGSQRKNLQSPPSSNSRRKPPSIVIVLEDLEGFAPSVLQDFVTICSNHLEQLPLVLVFGIATAVTTVHRLLPSGVSSRMCIEKFQTPPSSEYLTSVIEKVVMTSDVPFKLGDKVFTLLLDLFLFHDFSVLNFIKGLQLAMMEHFYNSPVSVLCQPLKQALAAVKGMNRKQLAAVKQVPSLASHIEGKSDKERKKLSQDQDSAKSLICELLTSMEQYHRCFFPVMRCLHACTGTLPKYPLGKQMRELYATCLSTSVCETKEYTDAMLLLRSLSRDELLSSLSRCYVCLEHASLPTAEFKETKKQIEDFIEKLEDVEELLKPVNAEEEEEEEELNLEAPKEKKLRLHDLKQKLQAMEKKKRKVTVYEALRTEAIDLLDKMFRKYLSCPSIHPLYEAYYYNDAAELRQHLSASPRATLQRGLDDPHCYIKDASLKSDGDYISPSLPDISIVYKLHLECGRLINLYDWMQAFAMIVQSDEEGSASDAKVDKVIQARFIRAVSELQFLGFIKSTKRKTDHVARLTWGGC